MAPPPQCPVSHLLGLDERLNCQLGVCLWVSLSVFLPLGSSCCFMLHSATPSPNALPPSLLM
jgi:hypothetical protein